MKIVKTILSLTVIAAVCAAVLATVNEVTKNQIAQIREQTSANAAKAVMPAVEKVEKLPVAEGETYASYVGRNKEGAAVAYAVVGVDEKGYGGTIALMVGLTPEKKVIGYRKLQASETPGLGMNLTEESFSRQFKGVDATQPILVKKDGGAIEAITSATITSRAVCRAVEAAAKKLDALKVK